MNAFVARIVRSKWIIAPLILFALVVGVQRDLINPTPEKTEEDKFSDFSNLPVSSALPVYISSLFLGAFRAIAVDILWMEYSEAKSKQLYHEQKQLVELLAHLQPRNEETWSYLGWDLAFNLAAMAPTPEEKWIYIREGLDRLMEGVRINANSAKLLFDIANTLTFKATWEDGVFQEDYLKSYADDVPFQRRILGGEPETLFPFEPSRLWFARTREKIREISGKEGIEGRRLAHVVAASGLAMKDSTMDIFIIEADFYEAMLHWYRGEYDAAAVPLMRAIRGIDDLLRRYDSESVSHPLFRKKRNLYAALLDAVPLVRAKAGSSSPDDLVEILLRLEPTYLTSARIENGYVFEWLSKVKQRAGGDRHEINDEPSSSRVLSPGRPIDGCTIAPTPGDIDIFVVMVNDDVDEPEAFRPVTFRVAIENVKGLRLRVNVFPIGDAYRENVVPALSRTIDGERETEMIVHTATRETPYLITITSADASPWPAGRSYSVELLEKPR